METALFWIAWGLISFWALKTFYYSFSKERLEGLRKAALGMQLSILVLTLLPWLPPSFDKTTGLTLALEGNALSVLFIILLVASIALLIAKGAALLKLASLAAIANTFVLFILMMQLRPETFSLSYFDIAPILAVLLLLVCDVAVLLLWQQLQLKVRKGKRR